MVEPLPLIALVVMTALTAIEAGVALVAHPALARTASGERAGRAWTAARLGIAMPPVYALAAALALLAALSALGAHDGLDPVLWASAAILLVAIIVGTILTLVPLNRRLADTSSPIPIGEWEAVARRWDRLHGARTVLLVVVLLAEFAAVLTAGASAT